MNKKTFVSNIPTPAGMNRCNICNRVTRNVGTCEGCLAKATPGPDKTAHTITGRPHSEPNLQSVFPRTETGRQITEAFQAGMDFAKPGHQDKSVTATMCGRCKSVFDFTDVDYCPGCGAKVHQYGTAENPYPRTVRCRHNRHHAHPAGCPWGCVWEADPNPIPTTLPPIDPPQSEAPPATEYRVRP